jgi:uncharacterized phage protein (TIGR01671 family)
VGAGENTMREIEFRGKRIDNGEWCFGDLIQTKRDGKAGILPFEAWTGEEIIPETVGQYIGLKDENGVKVFEGDIVRITIHVCGNSADRVYIRKRVCWFRNEFVFQALDKDVTHPNLIHLSDQETMEVIGNTHENPELLRRNSNVH